MTTPAPERHAAGSIAEAVAQWNADHPGDWPRASGECPMCGHRGCFGRMPDDETRWVCFSTNHTAPGIQAGNGSWHGDALDVEAHRRGCKTVDVLRKDGYLAPRPAPATPATVTPLDQARRPLRNNSYLTAVTIIQGNLRDVLGGRALELNAMTGRPELGRALLRDEDMFRIRAEIERCFAGGVDKNGNQVGLKLSLADVQNACTQVASMSPYHPVQRYLSALTWDRVERLHHVAEDVLGADRTPLNQAMVRRFFLSAVARAMRPGCKVDTVLILVGKQGCGKSSFFGRLAGDWFVDTAVDIHDKDSLQVLRTAWIYEWAELEVLRRAKDAAAAKAFLSSRIDTYRPSYGRLVIDVPRGCIIVGSTNNDEFLTDETGNRRFWPLRTGSIDVDQVDAQRDQLWAEAVVRWKAGEPWWLTNEESEQLAAAHRQYVTTDPWDPIIWAWAEPKLVPFSSAEVLAEALGKPKGQWTDADQKRVGRSLKRGGWKIEANKPRGGSRTWAR